MSPEPRSGQGRRRAQANLAALVAALVVLSATVGVTLALADGALAAADRQPGDRRGAATAERLVEVAPPLAGASFRVRVDGEPVVERGDPVDGVTLRRIVLVAATEERTRRTDAGERLTLPRRTDRIRLDFRNASVETVRANGRVVLHRPGGLRGEETVAVSRIETLTLAFDANATGTVTVTSVPERTRKATLEVTVDA
ncbi:hypothetical protein BRC97_05495 [Halobacteriales archaeon QS_6_71_20]|nr:MAG: hypothetical protein BRC97_05495 [Halobacteriales archaeon QS_6_71_20]